MGNCMSSKHKSGSAAPEHSAAPQSSDAAVAPTLPAGKPAPGEASQPPSARAGRTSADEAHSPAVRTNMPPSSTASSEAAPRPRADSSFDRAATIASSEDSRTPHDTHTSSPLSSLRRMQQPGATTQPTTNPLLTESTLKELNQASTTRRGLPSSTGGTTANTRPTDAPDLPELSDVPEATEHSQSPNVGLVDSGGASFGSAAAADVPSATPPPVAEGLPVVSLQDIAVMEQKQGRRGRRVRSRRGSTTASHASLSAIPENLEITPLHARSERSDSMRVPMPSHPVSRLADVQELDVRPCFALT